MLPTEGAEGIFVVICKTKTNTKTVTFGNMLPTEGAERMFIFFSQNPKKWKQVTLEKMLPTEGAERILVSQGMNFVKDGHPILVPLGGDAAVF